MTEGLEGTIEIKGWSIDDNFLIPRGTSHIVIKFVKETRRETDVIGTITLYPRGDES